MPMVGLAKYFRLRAYNNTGQNSDTNGITTDVIYQKFTSAGALSLAAEDSDSATANTGAYTTIATVDNSSSLYLGGHGTLTAAITSGSPSGNVELWLQESTDNTTWPEDGKGTLLCVIAFSTTATLEENFRL